MRNKKKLKSENQGCWSIKSILTVCVSVATPVSNYMYCPLNSIIKHPIEPDKRWRIKRSNIVQIFKNIFKLLY